MGLEKQFPRFRVTCHALEQGERIADSVGGLRIELWGVQLGVDEGDLLQVQRVGVSACSD